MKQLKVLFAAALLFVCTAHAADTEGRITIAADSSSGTYAKMLGEIVGVCSSDQFDIVQASGVSGGAPGNLDALVNNKANAAFMHSDVFLANSMADSSYAKYQTLVALYPEPIHILALRQSKTKGTGMHSFSTVEFSSLSDLSGHKVGAAGGGVFTGRILTGQGQGNFEVVPFEKGDQVVAALVAGEIDAAIFVGAAPLPNIEKLNKAQFKLLPIGDAISGRVSTVYKSVSISYSGLTNGPLKTLAPLAVIQTRKYSTPAKIKAQAHFRSCFYSHLDQLKDDGAPNWQQVDAADHGVLPWYELPAGK